MSGVTLTVDDAEVMEALARFQAASGNLVPVYKNIGEELTQSTMGRFRAGKGPDGKAWTPLSRRTVEAKRKAGHSNAILVMRGYLSGTIRYQVDADGVQVGTDRPYGAIHQFGGDIQIPARQQEAHVSVRTEPLKGTRTGKDGKQKAWTLAAGTLQFRRRKDAGKAGVSARTLTIGDHTVTIPGRPYLGLSVGDQAAALDIIADHLTMAVPQLEVTT
ncbi:phage virion morphogenesis protein [Niveispirillum sp. KHB5.9]|uniref:phage virion morphogenesis protein n=1 Tax=Niveispirillum sp. KHB5.9 TaxID=3400269 RepID=UPI003A8C1927